MESNIVAELVRDKDQQVLILSLFNLTADCFDELRPVLLHNGEGPLYHLRSEAGAHLDLWSPPERRVDIKLHGKEPWDFIYELCRMVGISGGGVATMRQTL